MQETLPRVAALIDVSVSCFLAVPFRASYFVSMPACAVRGTGQAECNIEEHCRVTKKSATLRPRYQTNGRSGPRRLAVLVASSDALPPAVCWLTIVQDMYTCDFACPTSLLSSDSQSTPSTSSNMEKVRGAGRAGRPHFSACRSTRQACSGCVCDAKLPSSLLCRCLPTSR